MNPSAADWIPKFLNGFDKQTLTSNFTDEISFYLHLKSVGFIYGVSVGTLQQKPISHLKLTKEEFTKVNLFHSLLFTHFQQKPDASYEEAIQNIVEFYKNIEKGKPGFFQKLTLSNSSTSNLEQILASRLHEANTVLKNNTASLITFALLYADVLAYREYLKTPKKLKPYLDELESTIVSCCFLALTSKEKKNKYDKQLLELFKSSSDYLLGRLNTHQIFTYEAIQYLTEKDILEKRYLLDLCVLAVHDDHDMDGSEHQFLQQLSILLQFTEKDLQNSIDNLHLFAEKYTAKIQLFEYSNPVQQFYKHSSKTVKTLILRNKGRLTKELEESGELVVLLGNSAIRELTSEEKKKVKTQLLDICKSVPSLTIFLLPGGTILLPLLVKLIPKLLPSSFQDNRIEKPK